MTFYVDLIWILCTLMNYLSLRMSLALLSADISRKRCLLSAAGLGILSLEKLVLDVNWIFLMVQTTIIFIFGIGICSFFELLKRITLFLGVTVVLSGIMNTINHSGLLVVKDENMIRVIPEYAFCMGAAVGMVFFSILIFFVRYKKNLYNMKIIIGEREIKTKALLDTGNGLKNPRDGRPVFIIEDELIPEEEKTGEYIKFKTASTEEGEIMIIPVKEVCLTEENKVFENVYAGITKQKLSRNGEFHALLHSELK